MPVTTGFAAERKRTDMKIVNSDVSGLFIGTIFRFKGKYPFCEEYVYFKLCDYPDCGEKCSPFALYCVSGNCAGHLEYVFLIEAKSENTRSIHREWFTENWNAA